MLLVLNILSINSPLHHAYHPHELNMNHPLACRSLLCASDCTWWVCYVGKCCVGRVTTWCLHMEIKMWGNCTGSLRSNVRSCQLFLNQAARRLRKDHILCLDLHVTEVFTHVCERRHLRVIASQRSTVVSRSSLFRMCRINFKEYLYWNKNRKMSCQKLITSAFAVHLACLGATSNEHIADLESVWIIITKALKELMKDCANT